MKIALACPASFPATQFGGILFIAADIASELSKIGHDVTIYTTNLDFANNPFTFNKQLPKEEKIDNYKINRSNVWFHIGLFFVNPEMYFRIKRNKPEIIHTIGLRSFQSLIAALASKNLKMPLVISDQGGLTTHPALIEEGMLKKILYRIQNPMIKFIINQASHVIVPNEYEEKLFQNISKNSKITVIKNGINLELLKSNNSDFKSKYKINDDFVLFLGRFNKVKGVDTLLNAWTIVKKSKRYDNKTKLVIMGADFGFEEEMLGMIKKLNLSDSVIVIRKPPREDVLASYLACNFLVLPSRWELSPLTPLEGKTKKLHAK